jgi:guanosine-3',5'-bis(diphosphate) 3'-pyrophosphohydrolase
MDELILRAARIAKAAHAGQLRKYRPRPYIEHPARVAASAMLIDGITAEEVAAAWLHDVIEDCGYIPERLAAEGVPQATIDLVLELTNPSKQHPNLPRAERKRLDREHLAHVSPAARRLKALDRIDNLRELQHAPRDFCSLYADESLQLAAALADVPPALIEDLYSAIEALGFTRQHRHT